MRMSRRLALYAAGGGKVTIPVHGAPNETVTLTGVKGESFTATTNEHGIAAALELPVGVYTVVGSVSKDALASRSVTVDKNTTEVTAYPPGAVFWFGNGDTEGDTLWSKCGGWGIAHGAYPTGYSYTGAANASYANGAASGTTGWNTWASQRASSTQYGATSYIQNRIAFGDYAKLRAYCQSAVSGAGSVIGTCAGVPSGAWTVQNKVLSGASAMAINEATLAGEAGYFAAAAFGARYYKPYGSSAYTQTTASNTVYAVWLE